MRTFGRSAIVSGILFLGLAQARVAGALDITNSCVGTSGEMDTPVFINVYWDLDRATWDADEGSLGITTRRLDALTNALISSQYFFAAHAEYGVQSWSMGPSLVAGEICPTLGQPPPDTGVGKSESDALAACVIAALPGTDPNNMVLNILYPMQTAPGADMNFCQDETAYHDRCGGLPCTWNPVNCNPSLTGMFEAMSHEMVEAITDDHPHAACGYKFTLAAPSELNFLGSEVGDLCAGGHSGPPGQTRHSPFMPTIAGGSLAISNYWSNAFQDCTNGSDNWYLGQGAPSGVACGAGKNMVINLTWTTDGQGLGAFPSNSIQSSPDSLGQESVYLSAVNQPGPGSPTSLGFTAGSSLRFPTPDKVFFGGISVLPEPPGKSSVVIHGFTKNVQISPGDTLQFTVTNPVNGLEQVASVVAQGPTDAGIWLNPDPSNPIPGWVIMGDHSTLNTGVVADCSVLGVSGAADVVPVAGQTVIGLVEDVASGLSSAVYFSGITDHNGVLNVPLQSPNAGLEAILLLTPPLTQKVPLAVHPLVTDLSPAQGDVAGGQEVFVTGSGFVQGRTTVTVAGVPATHVYVWSSNQISFATPPLTQPWPPIPIPMQPGSNLVPVVVAVDGIPSVPLTYRYIVPYAPVMTFVPDSCDTGAATLTVDAYSSSGSEYTELIDLVAPYGAFPHGKTSITVMAGTTINLYPVTPLGNPQLFGPVTATPEGHPALALTQSWQGPPNAPLLCYNLSSVLLSDQLYFGPDPVESTILVPTVDRASARWILNASSTSTDILDLAPTSADPLGYVLALDPAVASTAVIRQVGTTELSGLIATNPTIAVTGTSGVDSDHPGHHHPHRDASTVQFLGPAVAIDQGGAAGASDGPSPLLLSFSPYRGATHPQIVQLEPTPGSEWLPVASVQSQSTGLMARVSGSGVYALVNVTSSDRDLR